MFAPVPLGNPALKQTARLDRARRRTPPERNDLPHQHDGRIEADIEEQRRGREHADGAPSGDEKRIVIAE